MTRIPALLLSIVLACGCSSDNGTAPIPPAVDHDAQGSWGENTHGAITPGSLFLIAMTESSGVLTGTGSFSGEAGPIGSLVVSGRVANDSLHLQIIYVLEPHAFPNATPDTGQFVGVLTNRDQIDGTLTRRGGIPAPLGLIRMTINDPP